MEVHKKYDLRSRKTPDTTNKKVVDTPQKKNLDILAKNNVEAPTQKGYDIVFKPTQTDNPSTSHQRDISQKDFVEK